MMTMTITIMMMLLYKWDVHFVVLWIWNIGIFRRNKYEICIWPYVSLSVLHLNIYVTPTSTRKEIDEKGIVRLAKVY